MNYEDYKALRMKSWRFRLLYRYHQPVFKRTMLRSMRYKELWWVRWRIGLNIRKHMLRFWMWWDGNVWLVLGLLAALILLLLVSQTEQT